MNYDPLGQQASFTSVSFLVCGHGLASGGIDPAKNLLRLLTNPLPESLPGSGFMFFSQSHHERGSFFFPAWLQAGKSAILLLTSIPTYESALNHYFPYATFEPYIVVNHFFQW